MDHYIYYPRNNGTPLISRPAQNTAKPTLPEPPSKFPASFDKAAFKHVFCRVRARRLFFCLFVYKVILILTYF